MKRIHGITMDKQTYTCKTLNHFTYYSILHWRNGLNINLKKTRYLKCTTAREMYLFKFTLYIIYNKITNLQLKTIFSVRQRQKSNDNYDCNSIHVLSLSVLTSYFTNSRRGKNFVFAKIIQGFFFVMLNKLIW